MAENGDGNVRRRTLRSSFLDLFSSRSQSWGWNEETSVDTAQEVEENDVIQPSQTSGPVPEEPPAGEHVVQPLQTSRPAPEEPPAAERVILAGEIPTWTERGATNSNANPAGTSATTAWTERGSTNNDANPANACTAAAWTERGAANLHGKPNMPGPASRLGPPSIQRFGDPNVLQTPLVNHGPQTGPFATPENAGTRVDIGQAPLLHGFAMERARPGMWPKMKELSSPRPVDVV
ncbi:hypothetical protein NDN08_001330 [Rhodosorus marinus]|uniref:Uncharacterized protein n=1 Tax=Rhodosorus marinus TaxID=101924 RepID=A0AAV8UQJ2_9RHOD|nr:hypothetical protein NDN08_001330 [Rhodosorus marinus]